MYYKIGTYVWRLYYDHIGGLKSFSRGGGGIRFVTYMYVMYMQYIIEGFQFFL